MQVFYQSNHFWNWNGRHGRISAWFLPAINRTTFGIETMDWQIWKKWRQNYQSNHFWNWNSDPATLGIITFKLSIEPLLELKHRGHWWPAFRNHPINRTTFGIETYNLNVVLGWNGTINRTTFGIETRYSLLISAFGCLYQSNHFWNWNSDIMNALRLLDYLSIEPLLELKRSITAFVL